MPTYAHRPEGTSSVATTAPSGVTRTWSTPSRPSEPPGRPRLSVAERVRSLVPDPLPQGDGAAQAGALLQLLGGELPSIEADRADQVAASGVTVATDEVLDG